MTQKMFIGSKSGGVTVEVADKDVPWYERAGYKVIEEPAQGAEKPPKQEKSKAKGGDQ